MSNLHIEKYMSVDCTRRVHHRSSHWYEATIVVIILNISLKGAYLFMVRR